MGYTVTLKQNPLRACVAIALTVVCLAVFAQTTPAHANKKYASIVMDADTGIILHERYADKKLHPASLTKIMTLLMAFEAIEADKMDLNTRIRMSRHAATMVPSKLGLRPGSSIKLKDAIYALVTKSANDVAVAIAEHIGGSESNFATLMTNRAHQLGMRNTTFRNASGLHDPRQISTARDMAMLGQYVINAYPEYYRYFSTKNFTYLGKSYHNHNRLMNTYQGMDGMKTGYIAASGFNLVASAVRNNRRIIGVVFGGRSGRTRNDHMAGLLDSGFAKLNNMRIAKAQVPLPPRKPGMLLASNQAGRDLTMQGGTESADTRMASMGRLIGEGDYDLDKIRRIETGMVAMAAHTGRDRYQASSSEQEHNPLLRKASLNQQPVKGTDSQWAIQLGAFTSRTATDQALVNGIRRLPREYSNATRVVAPLKTGEGWLFRGRLGGMTQAQAHTACSYFRDCMTIAPYNH